MGSPVCYAKQDDYAVVENLLVGASDWLHRAQRAPYGGLHPVPLYDSEGPK